MSDIWKNQLDYIFFFYGAAFLLLVPICLFLRRRPHQQLAWGWLAWFGAMHGANEWLELLKMSLGLGAEFELARFLVLSSSFICLAEFGRASLAMRRGRGPGRWILLPLAGLAALGGVAGPAGLFATTRYVLGLTGGLWAAGALLGAAREKPPGFRHLHRAGLGMAGYALATAVVVGYAPFFPASRLNYDFFQASTGIPIQLWRGVLAIWICACLCRFTEACLEAEIDRHLRRWFHNLILGGLAGLVILLMGGWLITQSLGHYAARDKREDYIDEVKSLQRVMRDKMGEADHLVKILTAEPALLLALERRSPETGKQADAVLKRFSQALPGAVGYVMDLQGLMVASSHQYRPESAAGICASFRPYFQEAMAGPAGRYLAMGVNAKEMGYFASAAIQNQAGQKVGMAVIKMATLEIEEVLPQHLPAFVVAPPGIVVMASQPGMILRSLRPLSSKAREELSASQQFGEGPFIPILEREPLDGATCRYQGKLRQFVRLELPWEGWSMVILGSMQPIIQARLFGISITLLLCLALVGFLTVMALTIETAARINASEAKYRLLVEKIPAITYITDLDGKTIFTSPQVERLLGFAPSDFQSDPDIWKKLIHPDDQGRVAAGQYDCKVNGGPFISEYRLLTKSGKVLWYHDEATLMCNPDGQPLCIHGVMVDITQRREAEELLRQSEEGFRQLFESAADILILHDRGRIIGVNQEACRSLGFSREELSGLSLFDIEVGFNKDFLAELWEKEGGEVATLAGIYRRRDGSTFPVEIRAGEVTYRGQTLRLVLARDITERKRTEEALESSRAALQRSKEEYQKLAGQLLTAQEAESKRLARELHDDLTQRLAALAMDAGNLAQQQSAGKSAAAAQLQGIKDKLVKLSMDVNSISRRLHPSILEVLGLADAIATECSGFTRREGIPVDCTARGLPPKILPEVALSIYRIVQEGLRNISKHAQATQVEIALAGNDHGIHFSIKDNGIGFDPGEVAKKGGLGLPSMKERMLLLGGELSLQTGPGRGTRIEGRVPWSRSSA